MNSQFEQLKRSGIKRVKVLGPGEGNYCCAACSLLVDQEFNILNAPDLPPADCKCEGGSKIMYIAIERPKKESAQEARVKKIQDAGDKMQKIGCLMTFFITVPIILLFLFFGAGC